MPKQKPVTVCIKCGKPSQTVVCMSCFFQYETKSYSTDEDRDFIPPACIQRSEYKPKFKSAFLPDYQPELTANNRDEESPLTWREEIIAESHLSESPATETPENPEEKPKTENRSPISWFSRLPRFS